PARLADSLLHHLCRKIAGVLIAIGAGERPTDWTAEVLAARDRTKGGVTAPPGGLYLAGIRYTPGLGLPSEPPDPTMPPSPGSKKSCLRGSRPSAARARSRQAYRCS